MLQLQTPTYMLTMAVKETFCGGANVRLVPDLSFGLQEETIKVRIIRAWDGSSYHVPDELTTHFILLDEQDNQVLALAQPLERPRLLSQLHEGMVYYITNFRIVVGPTKWNPVTAERAIIFTRRTRIRACYDRCTIAKMKFDLCPLPAIATHFGKKTTLIDVSGVLFNVGDIKHYTHGVKKLDIQLLDENGTAVTVSLWGTQTGQFDMKFTLYRKKNVVVAITGLRVKHYDGHPGLASTPTTKFYFNPSYKQLQNLGDMVASKYGAFVCRLPLTEIYENLYPISVQRIYLNLREMKDPWKWVQPKLFKTQSFFCKVTIRDVLSCEEWCFRPVVIDEVPRPAERVYRCTACNMSFTLTSKSSQTVVLAADCTATTRLIMNTHELEQLTGLSVMQLTTNCVDNHAKHNLPILGGVKSMRGTSCTFEVEAPTQFSTSKIQEIMVKSIVESSKLIAKRKVGHALLQLDSEKRCRSKRQ